jgi:hypothetical protein
MSREFVLPRGNFYEEEGEVTRTSSKINGCRARVSFHKAGTAVPMEIHLGQEPAGRIKHCFYACVWLYIHQSLRVSNISSLSVSFSSYSTGKHAELCRISDTEDVAD